MAFEDSFTSTLNEILLDIPGYEQNQNNVDFSWIKKCNDKELNAFCDWISNCIPECYCTEEQLLLADKRKEDGLFIESDESVDDILKEFGYNDVLLNDYDIELAQSKLSEVIENIENITTLDEFVNSELEDINDDVIQLEQDLQYKKRKLNTVVADCNSYDFKVNSLLKDINNDYFKYIDMLERSFFNRTSAKSYLVLISSSEYISQHATFREKLIKYINSCHYYSSIPLHKNNTIYKSATSCNSTFCSLDSFSSEVLPNPLITELTEISSSLKKQYLEKQMLDATFNGLQFSLSKLDEMSKNIQTLWYEILESHSVKAFDQQSCFYEEIVNCVIGDIKCECDKWVEFQMILVLINVMKDKLVARKEKLNALNNILEIVHRNKAMVDLHWLIITMEQDLLENDSFNYLNTRLTSELEEFTKRKVYMQNILSENDMITIEPETVLACLKKILSQPGNAISNDKPLHTISKLLDNNEKTEQALLQLLENYKLDFLERCKEHSVLKGITFDSATNKIVRIDNSHIASAANSVQLKIDTLKNNMNNILAKRENQLHPQNVFNSRVNTAWITAVLDSDKLLETI